MTAFCHEIVQVVRMLGRGAQPATFIWRTNHKLVFLQDQLASWSEKLWDIQLK